MEKIGVLDFGGQYTHLIANRIRRLGVYSEVLDNNATGEGFCGVILSGGPGSVYDANAPQLNPALLTSKIPILGICYGHQLLANTLGGKVDKGNIQEYGRADMDITKKSEIFKELDKKETVWMSHGDTITKLPEGFTEIASTSDCSFTAMENKSKKIFGFQFHPEVTHTKNGNKILSNFIDICNCKREWNIDKHITEINENIKQLVNDKKVFLLVSGGVDSTVAFALLNNALGKEKVFGLHINTGLMRKNESEEILSVFNSFGFDNLSVVDAKKDFLDALKNITDPEQKRKIIGNKFLDVTNREIDKFNLDQDNWVLAQGTIYPDTIESGGTKNSSVIKTHHNRVDKIQELINKGRVIEPLADFYKDEVRKVGLGLGIPKSLIWRHPFPGPGLGVRILCSDTEQSEPDLKILENKLNEELKLVDRNIFVLPVQSVGVQGDSRTYAHPAVITGSVDFNNLEKLSTAITNNHKNINRVLLLLAPSKMPKQMLKKCDINFDRAQIAREADFIAHQVLLDNDYLEKVWQMPVVLLPLINENNEETIVLRPVSSNEAMTAEFSMLPENIVMEMAEKLINISGVGTVLYDMTHKPPGTIEWE